MLSKSIINKELLAYLLTSACRAADIRRSVIDGQLTIVLCHTGSVMARSIKHRKNKNVK